MSGVSGIDFALLKFCLEHNDSPNVKETQLTRDPADYEWLRKVIDSMPSVEKQIEQCLDIIHNDSDEDNKIDALQVLQDLVEDIDIANDLAKKGLGEIAQGMTYNLGNDKDNDKGERIRSLACWIMSTICQNNPNGQKAIIEQGILPIVLVVLKDNKEKVTHKALGIVSAMTRDNENGAKYFDENKDTIIDILHEILKNGSDNVITKACVVLRHLCSSKDSIKNESLKKGLDNELSRLSKESSDESVRDMAKMTLSQLKN